MNERLFARAQICASHAYFEYEAPLVDARSQRIEFGRCELTGAMNDIEEDGLELAQQTDQRRRRGAARRLPVEAIRVEQVAGPRLLGGDVDGAALIGVDEFYQPSLRAVEMI